MLVADNRAMSYRRAASCQYQDVHTQDTLASSDLLSITAWDSFTRRWLRNGRHSYLIDGSGYIFRAFFALPQLNNSRGMPTNAVYGFIRMLLKLLKEERPGHIAVVFDSPRKTFRDDLFESYKANRVEAPNDLTVQIPYIMRAVEAFRIKRLMLEGFEADDVIGTLAARAARARFDTVIVTEDKDFMQLVGPHVTLWNTMRDRRVDAREVRARLRRGSRRGDRRDGADGRCDRQRQRRSRYRRENRDRADQALRLARQALRQPRRGRGIDSGPSRRQKESPRCSPSIAPSRACAQAGQYRHRRAGRRGRACARLARDRPARGERTAARDGVPFAAQRTDAGAGRAPGRRARRASTKSPRRRLPPRSRS